MNSWLELAVPVAVAWWLARSSGGGGAPPATPPAREPPTTPAILPTRTVPGGTPATEVPRPRTTDDTPIDPASDTPRDEPPMPTMQKGTPGVSKRIQDAIDAERRRQAGIVEPAKSGSTKHGSSMIDRAIKAQGYRAARRPTRAQVARAHEILRGEAGPWEAGRVIQEGDTQYRMAWHGSGTKRHKGVEVWTPGGA